MIEVNGLRKRYRRKNVLDGVTFTAERGRITCLIGENGAGKSTALKAIMRLVPADAGIVKIEGGTVDGPALYEKVAYIPDRLPVPGSMRIEDAIAFMRDYYRSWNDDRAKSLLTFFGLDDRERIGNLSKGMSAKCNLVLGLGLDSGYVLMDEPFSGIDLFSREQIAEVFSTDLVEGRGVLLTTHELGEVEHLIDKAVLLKAGKVAREFDCEQVREEEGKSIVDVMREVYRA
ncbi:ABC transporter ATP-binding protein [Paenibacillus sp. TRM 82003]|nr:ABC transporter ATP-binding protein [Paenibacillus sp. TRM 82003]